MVCQISDFNMWTANLLMQASCTELTKAIFFLRIFYYSISPNVLRFTWEKYYVAGFIYCWNNVLNASVHGLWTSLALPLLFHSHTFGDTLRWNYFWHFGCKFTVKWFFLFLIMTINLMLSMMCAAFAKNASELMSGMSC